MTFGEKADLLGELPRRSNLHHVNKQLSTVGDYRGAFSQSRLSCLGEHCSSIRERNTVVAEKIQALDVSTRISSLKALRANIERGQTTQLSQEHVRDLVHALEDDEVAECRRCAAKALASLAMRRTEVRMVVPYAERLMTCIEDNNEADVVMAIMRALVVFGHAREVVKANCGEVIPHMLASNSRAVLDNAIELIALLITSSFGKTFWDDEFRLQELVVALAHLSTSGEHGMHIQLSAALCLQALVENGPSCAHAFYDPERGVKKLLVEEVLASDIIFAGEHGELLFGIVRAAVAHVDKGILQERFPTHKDSGELTKQLRHRLYYSEARRMLARMKDKPRMERRQSAASSQNNQTAEHAKSSAPSLRSVASMFQKIAHERHLGEGFCNQIFGSLDEKQMEAQEFQEQILAWEQAVWQQRQFMAGLMRDLMQLRSDGGLTDSLPGMEDAIKDIAVALKGAEELRNDCLEDSEQIESSLGILKDVFKTIESAVPEWKVGFQGVCNAEASKLDEGDPELKVIAERLRELALSAADLGPRTEAVSLSASKREKTARASICMATGRIRGTVKSLAGASGRLRGTLKSLADVSGRVRGTVRSLASVSEQLPSEERPSGLEFRSADHLADNPGEHANDAKAKKGKGPRNRCFGHCFGRSHLDKAAQDFMHLNMLEEEECFLRLPVIQGAQTGLDRYPQLALVNEQTHPAMRDDMEGEYNGRTGHTVPGLMNSPRTGAEAFATSARPRINVVDESPWSKVTANRHAATVNAWRSADEADHQDYTASAWRPASKGHRHVVTLGACWPNVDAPTPVSWSCKGWHRVRRGS
eukprot:TRINITY_DN32638_c0_g1_i1.p1 TRINITY_DN32638_c0_g1~~TRINITY_DN32638_c0_g1_i1.p1  ORF type:complete len:820 (+),score=137.50 TRINITY_DN32638_c0_g1_i1:150-2609(+)